MPVTKYTNPEQLQMLTAALEKHCQEFGIEDGEEHELLGQARDDVLSRRYQ